MKDMRKDEGLGMKDEGPALGTRLASCIPVRFHPSSFILHPSARRGVTLIELLVVVAVVLIMMGLAARQMQVAKDLRRNRETARAISVYLGSARSTALANRRPCGVVLMSAGTTGGLQNCVMTLQQAEVPAPYAGDSTSSVATVSLSGTSGTTATYQVNLSSSNGKLIHSGDVIQFNYEGPWLQIQGGGTSFSATLDMSQGQLPPPWTSSVPMPFRIYRQPYNLVTKSVASPLQLPASAVIDLAYSGNDTAGSPVSFSTNGNPIYILFSPAGGIQSVYQNGNNSFQGPVSTPIYLLVGKVAAARGFGVAPVQYNYQDMDSLWVVISPQNGLVSVGPVGSTTSPTPQSVSDSRGLARDAQLLKGW
jgi:prepilin-type N-terminal cleavage/methylation domain-containing protein